MKRHLLASIIAILSCSAATAGIPMPEYLKKPNDPVVRTYMLGVAEGMMTVHSQLNIDGKPKLFCLPDSLVLTNERMHQILMKEFDTLPREQAVKFEANQFLMVGLMKTFPCK